MAPLEMVFPARACRVLTKNRNPGGHVGGRILASSGLARIGACVLACILGWLTACGGQGMVATQPQPTPSPSVSSVTVNCNPVTVAGGGTSQCGANVQGTGSFSSSVTWSASVGAISSTGLFTAPDSAVTATITATSMQNPAVSGNTAVSVQAAPGSSVSSVSVACMPSTVTAGQTSQCSANVQGAGSFNPSVTWSASAGAISATGLFTAPADAGAVIVTATSVQNTSISGKATLTVQTQTTPPVTPPSKHVVMVMEENQGYSTVAGNTSSWPHLNALIGQGALATHYYANTHPSIGNYFMITTGQILTTNDSSTTVWNVDNIARRMLAAKVPFKVYAEGITNGYLGGNTGLYLIRHNPFAMLSDVAGNKQTADAALWPFTQFTADEASHALPEFSFVVPDVDDDAHSGTPQQADDWLQANVIGPLSGDPAFQPGGDGILIVVFDEALDSDATHGGGHVAAVFWGPIVKAGFEQTTTTVFQHQSMLRTVMEALGLPNAPGAGANAPSMAEFFVQK